MKTPKNEVGYVYIASNPAMPGYVKIGFTTVELDNRIAQLSQSTSVPLDFEAEDSILVEYPAKIERLLHIKLKNNRVNPKKEFFKVSPIHASSELRMILFGTPDWRISDDLKYLLYIYEKYEDRFAPVDKSGMAKVVIELLKVANVEEWSPEKQAEVIKNLEIVAKGEIFEEPE